MARDRLIEIKVFDNRSSAIAYRKSFAYYNESRLHTSVVFYATLTLVLCAVWGARVLLAT
ncbi:MAG: hypothetical protein JSS49_13225 [Planctomycetes bacterium]|nr:hypothetical protein [Planctomycetota bacterium]